MIKNIAAAALLMAASATSAQVSATLPVIPAAEIQAKTIPAPLLNAGMVVEPEPEETVTEDIAEDITEFAATLLGRKYVWGAVGPKTFDCSGFTSYVFRNHGITLPRTSRMQYAQGKKVKRDDLRAGDLMFFSSPRSGRGTVGHVGIVVSVDPSSGQLTFIHASTRKGITYQKFPDGGYYSRNYIGARRVIDAPAPTA